MLRRPWDSGAEIANFSKDIQHLVRPGFFVATIGFARQIQVKFPIVRVPGDLPVEVQTAQDLQSDIEPEAGSADALRFGVPAAFLDKSASSCDVVHPLEGTLRHDLIHVKYNGCRGADDCIAIWILQVAEKMRGCCIVIVKGFLFGVGRVDKPKVAGAAGQEGIEEHRLGEGMKREQPGEVFERVHAVHPEADFFDEDLHKEGLFAVVNAFFPVCVARGGRYAALIGGHIDGAVDVELDGVTLVT